MPYNYHPDDRITRWHYYDDMMDIARINGFRSVSRMVRGIYRRHGLLQTAELLGMTKDGVKNIMKRCGFKLHGRGGAPRNKYWTVPIKPLREWLGTYPVAEILGVTSAAINHCIKYQGMPYRAVPWGQRVRYELWVPDVCRWVRRNKQYRDIL